MSHGEELNDDQAGQVAEAVQGMTLDSASFEPVDGETATVKAQMESGEWLVYLAFVNDEWLITWTEDMAS